MMKVGGGGAEGKRSLEEAGEEAIASGAAGAPAQTEEVFGIRIARDGTWYHNDGAIRRMELVKLFATVLRRDEAGDYWLVTPVERGRVAVEDVPFVAVEMAARGEREAQVLSFRTNLDEWVEAGPDHPIRVAHNDRTGEPTPYVLIRNGLEARIARAVYYEMAERCLPNGRDGEAEVGLWSKGAYFPLGSLSGA